MGRLDAKLDEVQVAVLEIVAKKHHAGSVAPVAQHAHLRPGSRAQRDTLAVHILSDLVHVQLRVFAFVLAAALPDGGQLFLVLDLIENFRIHDGGVDIFCVFVTFVVIAFFVAYVLGRGNRIVVFSHPRRP